MKYGKLGDFYQEIAKLVQKGFWSAYIIGPITSEASRRSFRPKPTLNFEFPHIPYILIENFLIRLLILLKVGHY